MDSTQQTNSMENAHIGFEDPGPRPLNEPPPALDLDAFDGQKLDHFVPVYLPWNLSVQEFQELVRPLKPGEKAPFKFPALRNWLSKLLKTLDTQQDEAHAYHKSRYELLALKVEAADWFFKGRLGFMKIQSRIRSGLDDGDWIPGAVFLRGGSVAILPIMQPADASGEDEKQVIMTVQPRVAAGSLAFSEIPAGMLDDGEFKGTAANELKEEAHLDIQESELLDLSELVLADAPVDHLSEAESLEVAMYPSPGACDEFIKLYLYQKRLTHRHIEWLQGRVAGREHEGEKIRLKLVPLKNLWREGARDGKTLSALALYDNLKREGKIPEMSDEPAKEPIKQESAAYWMYAAIRKY